MGHRVSWHHALRFLTISTVVGLAACRTIPREECADSRRLPNKSSDEQRALLSSQPRSFSGLVRATYSKRPLVGASAYIEDLKITAVADSLGVFRFTHLPIGWHRVQLRTLGFEPLVDSVLVSPTNGTAAVYELSLPKSVRCQRVITS